MKKNSYRRKRIGKTNYRKRLGLLKSGKPRLVVRISNKSIYAQIIKYSPKGDQVLASAASKDLVKLGWNVSGSNTPAAYLVGYLIGSLSKDKQAVLDIGFKTPNKGAKVFAVLKGAVDSGLDIPHSKNNIPSKDRILGKHISDNIENIFNKTKDAIGAQK